MKRIIICNDTITHCHELVELVYDFVERSREKLHQAPNQLRDRLPKQSDCREPQLRVVPRYQKASVFLTRPTSIAVMRKSPPYKR